MRECRENARTNFSLQREKLCPRTDRCDYLKVVDDPILIYIWSYSVP